jgi:hypothetical protein
MTAHPGADGLGGFALGRSDVEQAPTAAMLVITTYRPELTPPWPQRSTRT